MSGYFCPSCRKPALAIEGRPDVFCGECANRAPVSGGRIEDTMPSDKVHEIIAASLVDTGSTAVPTTTQAATPVVVAPATFTGTIQRALDVLAACPMPPSMEAFQLVHAAVESLKKIGA